MHLQFDRSLIDGYASPTQRVRRMSEAWVAANIYCIACPATRIQPLDANTKARDFRCPQCNEVFELKATKSPFGHRDAAGAYSAMSHRITTDEAPNLMLLRYSGTTWEVLDLVLVPRHFMTLEILQKRPPLATTARRAGWVGCNIRLDRLPMSGRVHLVRDGVALHPQGCREAWLRMLFLRSRPTQRSWLIAIMERIERLDPEFSLEQLYMLEPEFRADFPGNAHIRPKIRQQLQVLRDAGYLQFLGQARYRRTAARAG